eukprot:5305520-Pleurochrysis_carterae.AAC.1
MDEHPQFRHDQDPDDDFGPLFRPSQPDSGRSMGVWGAGNTWMGGGGGDGGEESFWGRGRCAFGLKCCSTFVQRPTGYARVRRGRKRRSTPPWITAKAWLMAC